MYTTKPKEIPYNNVYDVIVIGGGPAGCAAAYSAAKNGAKTLVIEATGCLGGMATSGLVPEFCPYTDKEKVIYKGFAETVLLKMIERMPVLDPNNRDWVSIDSECLKILFDELLTQSGADVLFNSVLSDVDTDGKNISAVIITNKAGMSAYSAKVYIDCTGDADLASRAGCECHMGSDGDTSNVQKASHCFKLSGVTINNAPKKRLNVDNDDAKTIYKLRDDEELDLITDAHICDEHVGTDTMAFNAGHVVLENTTDPMCISKGLMQGRKTAQQFLEGLKKYVPELYKNAFLAETAPLLGIRESRRIAGDYELNVDDYLERRSFDDEIGRNSYFIDMHGGLNAEQKAYFKERSYKKGDSHGIPYRCLVPKDMNNMLAAGRIISCDRYVHSSIRIMPACFVTGEAAGCAAAMAVSSGDFNVHNVDVNELRERLRKAGAYFS